MLQDSLITGLHMAKNAINSYPNVWEDATTGLALFIIDYMDGLPVTGNTPIAAEFQSADPDGDLKTSVLSYVGENFKELPHELHADFTDALETYAANTRPQASVLPTMHAVGFLGSLLSLEVPALIQELDTVDKAEFKRLGQPGGDVLSHQEYYENIRDRDGVLTATKNFSRYVNLCADEMLKHRDAVSFVPLVPTVQKRLENEFVIDVYKNEMRPRRQRHELPNNIRVLDA